MERFAGVAEADRTRANTWHAVNATLDRAARLRIEAAAHAGAAAVPERLAELDGEWDERDGPNAGESHEADEGVPEFQRTPGRVEDQDPRNPAGKPQGTLQDQQTTMDSEGHPVTPPSTEAG